MESLLLSSKSWCSQGFVCALQDWNLCFPQSCGSLVIKSPWTLRSDSLGIPSPFVRSPGWEVWGRVPNLHNSGKTSLVLLFSRLWVTHSVGMGFDFIMIEPPPPPPPSCCRYYSLYLDVGYLFLVGSSVLLSTLVAILPTLVCNFGIFAGGDKHVSFYSNNLNWKFCLWLFLTNVPGELVIDTEGAPNSSLKDNHVYGVFPETARQDK